MENAIEGSMIPFKPSSPLVMYYYINFLMMNQDIEMIFFIFFFFFMLRTKRRGASPKPCASFSVEIRKTA